MLGNTYPDQECSAARTLELVGERWTLLILRDAMFRNYIRFSQFTDSLGIATNVLSKRLDGLVKAGLIEARQTGAHPEHHEYHLTAKGLDMKTVVMALTEWGDKWLGPGPVEFKHIRDDGLAKLQVRCARCDEPIDPAAIVARRRPTSGS
jgi:DNA-binding HxlR family transcriptional regulator